MLQPNCFELLEVFTVCMFSCAASLVFEEVVDVLVDSGDGWVEVATSQKQRGLVPKNFLNFIEQSGAAEATDTAATPDEKDNSHGAAVEGAGAVEASLGSTAPATKECSDKAPGADAPTVAAGSPLAAKEHSSEASPTIEENGDKASDAEAVPTSVAAEEEGDKTSGAEAVKASSSPDENGGKATDVETLGSEPVNAAEESATTAPAVEQVSIGKATAVADFSATESWQAR